jgi:predicted nucleic acid-binding protein
MPFVLDASVTAAWAFAEESSPVAARTLAMLGSDQAVVPPLWWFEIRNVMLVNERRGRVNEEGTAFFLRRLSMLPIAVEPLSESSEVLRLARLHALTVYDAAYLELALRTASPLATLDGDLIRAARSEGVAVIEAKPRPPAKKPPGTRRS